MTVGRRLASFLLAAVVLVANSACGRSDLDDVEDFTYADGGRDARTDARDAPRDVPLDVLPDGDAPIDVPSDVPIDVPADTPADQPQDRPIDVPIDTPPDVPRDRDFFDSFPLPDSGPIADCARCAQQHCNAQVNGCYNDQACVNGLVCAVSTCLGGGGPDIGCVLNCFNGDFGAAMKAFRAFRCIATNCGSACSGASPRAPRTPETPGWQRAGREA